MPSVQRGQHAAVHLSFLQRTLFFFGFTKPKLLYFFLTNVLGKNRIGPKPTHIRSPTVATTSTPNFGRHWSEKRHAVVHKVGESAGNDYRFKRLRKRVGVKPFGTPTPTFFLNEL